MIIGVYHLTLITTEEFIPSRAPLLRLWCPPYHSMAGLNSYATCLYNSYIYFNLKGNGLKRFACISFW